MNGGRVLTTACAMLTEGEKEISGFQKKKFYTVERLEGELESAREEAENPFPQEAELAEKSKRLTELNTELDKTEHSGVCFAEKGKVQGNDDPEKEDAAPEEETEQPETAGKKPSILGELRQFERPAPVQAGGARGKEEVI